VVLLLREKNCSMDNQSINKTAVAYRNIFNLQYSFFNWFNVSGVAVGQIIRWLSMLCFG
jgi:hypothetical protein